MELSNNIQSNFQSGMKAFTNNDYALSEKYFTLVLEAEPDFRLGVESRGAARLRLDKLEEAIADFNRALELSPEHARPYHLRGLVNERRGDLEQALADFNQAIAINPDYAAAYHSRSLVRNRRGETELADDDLRMFKMLTEKRLEEFANEHNVWRSAHMAVEEAGAADVMVDR